MDFPARYRGNLICALHAAIHSHPEHCGRKFMLVYILEDLSDVHSIERRDKDGLTPMLLAAKLGHNRDVKLLIRYRASLRAEDNDGFTALHWAVAGCHERVVRTLLREKAVISHVAADRLNPLQRAISDGSPQCTNLSMVKLLLEYGANANGFWDSSKRLTVLHQAVIKNNRELVVLLLEHKATTSTRDERGRKAVEYDKDGGMVDLLIEHSLSERYACGRDLICAAKLFKVDLVRRLIESGVDVNSRDSLGRTALLVTHFSAAEGYDGDDAEIIDLLLKAGANPYMPDYDLHAPVSSINISNSGIACLYDEYCELPSRNGPTKLHQAVAESNLDNVEDLLNNEVHKSRINKKDDQGFTALHYAVLWNRHNSEEIVQHLIDAKADPNTPDIYGCTSLHYAAAVSSHSLTKLILDAGGNLAATDGFGRKPADIAILRLRPVLHKMFMIYGVG